MKSCFWVPSGSDVVGRKKPEDFFDSAGRFCEDSQNNDSRVFGVGRPSPSIYGKLLLLLRAIFSSLAGKIF